MILRNYRQHYRIENLRKIIEKLSLSKKIHLSPTPSPKGTWQVLFAVLVESSDFYHLLGAKVKAYKVPLWLVLLLHGFSEVEAVVSSLCR